MQASYYSLCSMFFAQKFFLILFDHLKLLLGDMIPPSSTLHFDVELVQVADGEVPPNVFKEIDIDEILGTDFSILPSHS